MLNSSQLCRNLRKPPVLVAYFKRGYNYQTELYARKLELKDVKLTEELKHAFKHRANQPQLARFIDAYQQHGVKLAQLDPLEQHGHSDQLPVELNPETYGLDSAAKISTEGLLFGAGSKATTVAEIEVYLRRTYAANMAIEFNFINNEEEKLWIAREFEAVSSTPVPDSAKIDMLKLLINSQIFDHFLSSKFPTFKRYSLEGGESSMAFYYSVFSNLAKADVESLVMGIAHRGRLNLMVGMLDLDPVLLFAKIKGKSEFAAEVTATGDVAHHLPCSTDLEYDSKLIHVSLVPNPSHLEAVDPLVLGKARSKQMLLKDGLYADDPSLRGRKVATFLIHGDAAFAGQGIVAENFQLSQLPSYATGGTIHLLTNNQLGFTTPSHLGRSGNHNTDLAKAFNCPIIHVNGDHPELAYKAAEFAVKYRNKFAKDVVVDLVCFRKYGHNELDDPSFTNPLMYKKINARKSVPDLYKEKLVNEERIVEKSVIQAEAAKFRSVLDASLDKVLNNTYKLEDRNTFLRKQWSQINVASSTERTFWNTGCDMGLLKYIGVKSVSYPPDFVIHPTIERSHVKRRIEKVTEGQNIDWSTAESLAIGSLLTQGFNVRISGQEVGRGTFSQRHAMLYDQSNNNTYIPLNNLTEGQKNFYEICSSNLSEEAVMGFDYGFSMDNPNHLVIWEAQFGDFFNGAQIIIDQYVTSSEQKWMHQSAFVLLLPHGLDGAGPEHSSCRIERFLQMSSSREDRVDADNINYYIAHPTTPANYFHLLRRQMLLPYRKPLVVASPKLLIRLPECVSPLSAMATNTHFLSVIDDQTVKAKNSVKRLIYVFGKHYYALEAEKVKRKAHDVAIVRVEELSPFPAHELRQVLNEYKNAKEFVWAQEEHRNMGGWFFAAPRFERILGQRLNYAGREVHNTITGIGAIHAKEVKEVLSKPFEKL